MAKGIPFLSLMAKTRLHDSSIVKNCLFLCVKTLVKVFATGGSIKIALVSSPKLSYALHLKSYILMSKRIVEIIFYGLIRNRYYQSHAGIQYKVYGVLVP